MTYVCLCLCLYSPLAATNLRVEYLPSPVVIALDTATPRFSWQLRHTDRGETQSSYQLHVTTPTGKIVWNSGKVKSSQSTLVSYGGPKLAGQSIYTWNVVWYDSKDVVSPSSDEGSFELAIMSANVWDQAGSKWIASGNDEGNMYRHDFLINTTATITKARAYVAGK